MSGYYHLTDAEKAYVKRHPYNAYKISECKDVAISETKKEFGHNGHNDESDAFRHCIWSALIASEIGYNAAIEITTLHESQPGNPINEKAMDLHNNKVGVQIGSNGGATNSLCLKCIEALKNGTLRY
jgi:hypothetical protein